MENLYLCTKLKTFYNLCQIMIAKLLDVDVKDLLNSTEK